MSSTQRFMLALAAAGLTCLAGNAKTRAASLYSNNFSSDTLGDLVIDAPAPSGSNSLGTYTNSLVGLENPPSGSLYGAYFNTSSASNPPSQYTASVSKDIGALAPNTDYTLQAYAGHRTTSPPGTLTVELFNDTTLLSFTPINELTGVTVGDYVPVETSFTTGGLVTGDLIIRLLFTNDAYSGQTWVSDVSLDGTAVPEPASLGLLSAGALLLGRRRRHAI